MNKFWIGAAVLVVLAGIAAAVLLGAFDRPRPAADAGTAGQAAGGSALWDPEITPDDRFLGSADAPVTIIEYASLTCPHCAHFHLDTLPELKAEYIDTGKVRLVFRDFPLDQTALMASGLARCVPAERFFPVMGILFGAQATWATAPDPVAALTLIGRTAGLSDEEIRRCTSDEKHLDAIVAQRMAGDQRYQIRSTPSFVIAGKTYSGSLTIEQLREILTPLVP